MSDSSFLNPSKALLNAGLHEGMHVADFAAASGFFVRSAARLVGPQGIVWAVELNRDLLPRIKNLALAEGLENVEVVQGDISKSKGSKLPNATIDFCILANALFTFEPGHYLPVLKEMERVLRPGGRALVIDWTSSHGGLGPHTDHVISKKHFEQLLPQTGLTVIGEIPAGDYHWGLIVRKGAASAA